MRRARAAAFTIVELLIVVTIVIVLLSILIVAVSAATRTSQKSKTQYLMNSIKVALVRFKGDIGYYPPVLGTITVPGPGNPLDAQRKLWNPPNPDDPSDPAQGKWYSTTSIPEYLLGYGHHYQDGHGETGEADDARDWSCAPNIGLGAPPPPCESVLGIRHPGVDGVWRATTNGTKNGLLSDRMRQGMAQGTEINPYAFDQGKVYGPYLELQDDRLLGCIVYISNDPVVAFPGDAEYDASKPHVVVDYWGHALRYYRKPYPVGALTQSHRAGVDRNGDGNPYNDPIPTLSDFFFLRPYALKPGAGVTARLPDGNNDTTTTSELEAAEFAIFSAGPDKAVTNEVRVDENDAGPFSNRHNKDNLVELGP
ncbi:MAG: type II secretion system GspH family protein [Phycisphaerales bacterium]|nr:type II secretion system GspH family protein [Phycisphaerales bacterium]MCI0632086.1 type II secretion system GspH family protein [Phycisphaerales bacterium]MCI0677006.1 type II secretion system GspH family protein [Phycisphaerales bacterium]